MNLTGKIGDLMDLGFNYNTEATFDFDNQLNLDYSGKEDDILQKSRSWKCYFTLK